MNAPITDALSYTLTSYYHDNHGQGIWFTPYVPTPGGAPISVRTTECDNKRGGTIGRLNYDDGANHVEIGGWYEVNKFQNARRF